MWMGSTLRQKVPPANAMPASTQTLTLWDSNSFTPSLCHRPLQCQVLRQATRSKDLPNESEIVPGSQPDCRAWATVTTNGPPTIFSIMKWRVIIQGSSPIDMSSQTLAACWQFLDAYGSRVGCFLVQGFSPYTKLTHAVAMV